MANSMDSFVERGRSDVEDQLKKGLEDIEQIGEEYEGVKDQLQDIPGGLDDDLLAMIEDAKEEGKAEALQDIESANNAIIDAAKSAADDIKGDVQSKISDNNTAMGKLDGISSKYGKDSISDAKSAISDNTEKGEELMRMLDDLIKDADQNVESVKRGL